MSLEKVDSIYSYFTAKKFFLDPRFLKKLNYYSRVTFWSFYLDNDDILRITIYPMS